MLLLFLEAACVFLFGYIIAAAVTHENDDISASLLIPALIAEVFIVLPLIIIRAGSWSSAVIDATEWALIVDNWQWGLIGFIVFWIEQFLSSFLELSEEDETIIVYEKSRIPNRSPHMGASATNFDDKSLDIQSITIVKLTHSAFGHLDRQVSASVEANLNIRPNQRKNVQRLLAQVMDEKSSVAETLLPLKRMQQGGHNAAYSIFDKLCVIAAQSQRYSQATLNNLISIAQQLGLSQEEIYYLFQKSRLAV